MSTPAPAAPRSAWIRRFPDLSTWLPKRKALLWVLAAFGLGLLLFVIATRGGREEAFFRNAPVPPTAVDRDYAPLPAPVAAGEDGASRFGEKPQPMPRDQDGRPQLVETRPPTPPGMPVPAQRPASAPVATSAPRPLAGSTPSPRYPSASLRRGESGTVIVNARIDARGVPVDVSVADGSGSRHLDRAAVDAVKRWRFQPALADGRPTEGSVRVPVEFNARR